MPDQKQLSDSFSDFFSQVSGGQSTVSPVISEPPGAKARLDAGIGGLIGGDRKSGLFKQYVKGLVHPQKAYRIEFARKAVQNIKDPAERAWLTEEVQKVSRAQEQVRRANDAKAGYWQRFKDRASEIAHAPLEGMTEARDAFVGPNRIIGGLIGGRRHTQEDVSFLRGLESAKLSENPYISKQSGTLQKGLVGAATMVPELAAGGIAFASGGAPALIAYSALRTTPGAVESSQELGLTGPQAAVAGAVTGAGVGLIEAALPDPTGLLKKGTGPLAVAGRKAIAEFAQKAFPAAVKKGGKVLTRKLKTKAALKELSEYAYRVSVETFEEGGQGAWTEAVNVAASLLSDNVDPRERWSIPESFIMDVKESALPIAIIGGAGPVAKRFGVGEGKLDVETVLRKHHADGTVPSRKEWKELGGRKATAEEKPGIISKLVSNLNIREQVLATHQQEDISDKQWKRWGLPNTVKDQEDRMGYLESGRLKGEQMEVEERGQIEQAAQPQPAQEVAQPVQETVPQAPVSEVAPEQAAVSEAPEAPRKLPFDMFKIDGIVVTQNPSEGELRDMEREAKKESGAAVLPLRNTLDKNGNEWYWNASEKTHAEMEQKIANRTGSEVHQFPFLIQDLTEGRETVRPAAIPEKLTTADLNNEIGDKWLEGRGLDIPEGQTRPWSEVIGSVIQNKLDENALTYAELAISKGRLLNDREHVAMAVKLEQLQNELNEVRKTMFNAKEFVLERAQFAEKQIVDQIDLIHQASRFSGTEVARTLNIRRLMKNREKFQASFVIDRMQAVKESPLDEDEKSAVARVTREYGEIEAQTAQFEMQDQQQEDNRKEKAAEKVLNANKKSKGRKIKEEAKSEIEDIKDSIRKLGFEVHDVSQLSVKGLFLIGKLGVAYAKSGYGTFNEIVERIQKDMSQYNLTKQEVWRAILTRDPGLKRRKQSKAEKDVRNLKTVARMLTDIDSFAKGIIPEVPKRPQTSQEIKQLKRKLEKARYAFYSTNIEAKKIERAILTLNRLQDDLSNGAKETKKTPRQVPARLADVNRKIAEIRSELSINEEIVNIDRQIESGVYDEAPTKVKKPVSKRLEKKQIELAEKRAEIRQLIESVRPLSPFKKFQVLTAEQKAVRATADVSFTFRQNLWPIFVGITNPNRVKKTFSDIGRSMTTLLSNHSAQEIANGFRNSENAELADLAGVIVMDPGSPGEQNSSEVFRGKVIENWKIPDWVPVVGGRQNPLGVIMAASSRHSVSIGNMMRRSAFDYFLEKRPNATMEEMKAMGDYINKSTGIGDLSFAKGVAPVLQEAMFSPKFAVSRFQTPWAAVRYRKLPRVRNQVAEDMVRVVSLGGMILMLAKLAGADVELWDWDSPDWLKIRLGNTRYDLFGGFLQPARYIARMSAGTKGLVGIEQDYDPVQMTTRMLEYKLAPAYSTILQLLTGETAVGEEVSKTETAAKAFVPLITEAIGEAWVREGAATAFFGVGPATFLGFGANTYFNSLAAAKRQRDNFRRRGQHRRADQVVKEFNKRLKLGQRKLPKY